VSITCKGILAGGKITLLLVTSTCPAVKRPFIWPKSWRLTVLSQTLQPVFPGITFIAREYCLKGKHLFLAKLFVLKVQILWARASRSLVPFSQYSVQFNSKPRELYIKGKVGKLCTLHHHVELTCLTVEVQNYVKTLGGQLYWAFPFSQYSLQNLHLLDKGKFLPKCRRLIVLSLPHMSIFHGITFIDQGILSEEKSLVQMTSS
jgi:hypothetical protein